MKKIPVLGVVLIGAGAAIVAFAVILFGRTLTTNDAANDITSVVNPAPTAFVINSKPPTAANAPVSTDPARAEAEQTIAAFVIPSPTLAPIPTFAPTATPAPKPINALPVTSSAGRPVRVIIGAIHVDTPVVDMGWRNIVQNGQDVTVWDLPNNEVGHSINSGRPGQAGNVVLSGHNNLFAQVFRKLYTLKPDDEIVIWNAAGGKFLYRVTQSYIVKEAGESEATRLKNAQVLLPTTDARVTLISCWPETNNTHRAIVIAEYAGPVS